MYKSLLIVIFCLSIIRAQVDTSNSANPAEFIGDRKAYPKHSISVGMALWNNANSLVSKDAYGLSVDVEENAKLGILVYSFYPNKEFAVFLKAEVMETKVKVENIFSYTSTLIPVALGIKYFLLKRVSDQSVKPYISGAAGLLIGEESSVRILSIQHHTESVLGLSAAFGAEILFEDLIKLYIDLGYNLFGDFTEAVAYRKNYSGPEFSFGAGLVF